MHDDHEGHRSVMSSQAEDFAIVARGKQIGTVIAEHRRGEIAMKFGTFNNGRGSSFEERLRLNPAGLPVEWSIDGTTPMGGPVAERLRTRGHARTWASQADEGQDDSGSPKLYVAADSSPYAAGIYARAALAAGGVIDALPSGSVCASLLTQAELEGSGGRQTADVYQVTGAALRPLYVLTDRRQRLMAVLGYATKGALDSPEVLVRSDFAACHTMLNELYVSLTQEHLGQIQQRVRRRCDQPVRIRDVRVFDPHARKLTGPVSVTIFRGRITRIEADATAEQAPGPAVIDGEGGTLIAGLHDMHAHVSAWTGVLHLAAGVTTVRDMGNDNEALLRLRADFDAGAMAGPSIVPSGLIEGASKFALQAGIIPETLNEALEAAAWYADRGYHQIKIYNSMNPQWVKALTAEAHRLGMRAVGHVPAFTTPDHMIQDGYDEITHVNLLMLGWLLEPGEDTRTALRVTAMGRAKDLDLASPRVQHTMKLMRDNNTGLDTTAVILERLMLSRARTVLEADAPYLAHMPVSYQRARQRTYVPHSSQADLDAFDKSFPKLLDAIGMLDGNGIDLWPGTDDGSGFTLHRELELYVAAGLAPASVLRRATYDCAVHLGLGHSHGSIERGKAASFLLVDGDPTADISAIRNIRMVVKDGDIYFPCDIYAELGIKPFSAPPPHSM
jgi:hypothetical protein